MSQNKEKMFFMGHLSKLSDTRLKCHTIVNTATHLIQKVSVLHR